MIENICKLWKILRIIIILLLLLLSLLLLLLLLLLLFIYYYYSGTSVLTAQWNINTIFSNNISKVIRRRPVPS